MEKKNVWEISPDELMKKYKSSPQGLSPDEASLRQEKYGKNLLAEAKKESIFQIFFRQFADLLVVILIIAAVISAVSGSLESTFVILAVLILNALLGTIQQVKAKKSLDSLKELSSPSAKVRRDGKLVVLAAKELVPGDIVELEAGDVVVADGRLLSAILCQVNESSLTGESANVEKTTDALSGDIPLADRTCMVYSGSLITSGKATMLVTATGMDTELGKIANLLNTAKDRRTPLQQSLDAFSQKLAIGIMVICLFIFILCLYRDMSMLDSMMFAVSLAVAAIPEALGSIITIVQAMGTGKMAKENAIIKDLKAVESLGCVSVICSDKTGTLTQNKMTVQEAYVDGNIVNANQLSLEDSVQRLLVLDAVLCNSSFITDHKGVGDPTEYALLYMCGEDNVKSIRQSYPLLQELPFDSDRKLMSVKVKQQSREIIFTKGAVDILLKGCDQVTNSQGIAPITEADREKINQVNKYFSQKGLRVLAFAYKESDEDLTYNSEKGLTFLGLISMMDPPREESAAAVAQARSAGIKPVMITGDHQITAQAIAESIGIYSPGDLSITGAQLDTMTDEELDDKIDKISVYARVSPENKIRIVDAWQKRGAIVAMTGDGVNDAPALKKADIGIAMGITGTEVSKDAAAMILADDNFASIIKAVENGRVIYRNIKNAILFLLSGNAAGIFTVLFTVLAGLSLPFAPVHLLFINLITDSLPALAIGMEDSSKGLLKEAPRDSQEGIMTNDFLIKMLLNGGLIAIASSAAFLLGLRQSPATASTMAFATLCLARLFHGFNCRDSKSIIHLGLLTNKYSLWAFLSGTLLLFLVLLLPGLTGLFSVTALRTSQLVAIILLAFYPTFFIQIGRIIKGH